MIVISIILLLFGCLARIQGQERSGWAGYEEHAELRGWLKFHATPADFRNAFAACLGEDAQLASPRSSAFTAAVSSLQARHGAPLTHSGLRAFLSGEPVLSLPPSDLVRGERCGVLFANGTEGETACDRRLPFVCYAPVPTAPPADSASTPAPTPTPASASTSAPTSTSASTSAPTSTSASTPSPITTPSTIPTSAPRTGLITTPQLKSTTITTTTQTTKEDESDTVLTTDPTVTGITDTPAPTSVPTSEPITSNTQTPAPESTICTDMGLDAGYEWAEVTSECYKFHGAVANWTTANATCVAEGARFGVPGSDEEAQLFAQLLKANRDKIIGPPNIFKGAVLVGIYYENGTWITVDGIPLVETGYSKWWPGWPFYEEQRPRAYLEHTGRIENTFDQVARAFICEAAPPPASKNV